MVVQCVIGTWKKIVNYNNGLILKVNSYFVNLNDKDLVKTVYRVNDGIRRKS